MTGSASATAVVQGPHAESRTSKLLHRASEHVFDRVRPAKSIGTTEDLVEDGGGAGVKLTTTITKQHRNISPGLVSRLQLFDRGGHKTLSRSRSIVGRIPEENIRALDQSHLKRSDSIQVSKRGRAWSSQTAGEFCQLPDLHFDRSESLQEQLAQLETSPAQPKDSRQSPVSTTSVRPTVSSTNDPDMTSEQAKETELEKSYFPPVQGNGSLVDRNASQDGSTGPGNSAPNVPRPMDSPAPTPTSTGDADSYFNPFRLARPESVYSLSRTSITTQLSQLTSLNLPQASTLSANIASIQTASAACKALAGAAEQIQRWIQKASEVLSGLDAEDDVEWASAGGRKGLGDVDKAMGTFGGLVGVYVTAIEELQSRPDIKDVSAKDLDNVVSQMEETVKRWEEVRKLLHGVKRQVDLAMEWGELWNNVLGDVGSEMNSLNSLIFEMEEKRHRSSLAEHEIEGSPSLDIEGLETIVEETPLTAQGSQRFSITPAFPHTSPLDSPVSNAMQDDSRLMSLFARMQPLRASLDFLPMRLSMFQSRAETVFPSACAELESRREQLEKGWKELEADADDLRRELGEDKWLKVFRNAGRQAQKMCDSVERSINKLHEAVDAGPQQMLSASSIKKIESLQTNFEAKNQHYGPAIERVLEIIKKGIDDRLTVNGEILRLQSELNSRWAGLGKRSAELEALLDEMNLNKSQHLRDSISSILTTDRSGAPSSVETPGSSPASSVVVSAGQNEPSTPGRNNAGTSTFSKRSSLLPRKTPSSSGSISRTSGLPSPSYVRSSSLQTPTPPHRPGATPTAGKPRWNSSANTNDLLVGHHFRPSRPDSALEKHPGSSKSLSSIPLRSGLSREASTSPPPSYTSRRPESRIASSPIPPRIASPLPTRTKVSGLTPPVRSLSRQPSASNLKPELRRRSFAPPSNADSSDIPTPTRPKTLRPGSSLAGGRGSSVAARPATSLANTNGGRRSSALLQPRANAVNGRESSTGLRKGTREGVLPEDKPRWK